ncbi:MAG: FAD-binding oxidoreductase [Actinobacteria bacterium]|nr:FAD-binding oxidoreductase [Actinomycetota bacterium]
MSDKSQRSLWAWGRVGDEPDADALAGAAANLGALLGFEIDGEVEQPTPFDADALAPARIETPPALSEIVTPDARARAERAWGSSYQDVIHGFRGDFRFAPDAVATPRDENQIEQVLEWAAAANAAVIPYGGGTSVVGGVRPEVPSGYDGVITLDMGEFDQLLELDDVSQAARIQAGAAGPVLEKALEAHGMTMRFYPQSFEFATLGGWIVTRAGGHFATVETHIDDLVESVRAITPSGLWQSFRLPASGAGPSPDRMLLGSEGTLGVVTESWVRVRPRPTRRAQASVLYERFEDGVDAVRAIAQSGLRPSNCRLIEAEEARFTLAGDGSAHLMVLGFESAGAAVDERFEQAKAIAVECGGVVLRSSGGTGPEGAASEGTGGGAKWRETFIRAPYIRNTLVACGVLAETFETVTTWDRFSALRDGVISAVAKTTDGRGKVTCRFTHIYPDGPAPYFTVLAPAARGDEVAQWQSIKEAVSEVLSINGASITHHHAVGRDHRPWYERQRPEPFAAALRAAKAELDPTGMLNPGCLFDPLRP